MSVIGSNVLAGASGGAVAGYEIERSLRFNSADSAYLNRTPSSAGNRKTWTWSGWVKRSKPGTWQMLLSAGTASTRTFIGFVGSDTPSYVDQIAIFDFVSNGATGTIYLNPKLRDFSAWYHIVISVDTTDSTAENRVKGYINGELVSKTTTNEFDLNSNLSVNDTVIHETKKAGSASEYIDGYLADVHFIDGQALAPTDFGEYDADTGVWQPIEYAGTYGLVTIEDATGALPILNTTGSFGETLGSGVRSDSNASSLVLASALGTSNGLNLTDQSPTGRTASTLTLTGSTGVSSVTASSIFYGGSARFSGTSPCNVTSSNSSTLAFGSSDYTIECWFKVNGAGSNAGFNTILDTRPGDTTDMPVLGISNNQIVSYGFPQGSGQINHTTIGYRAGKWNHIAVTKSGTTHRIFLNGFEIYQATSSNNPATTTTKVTIGESNSAVTSGRFTFNGDVQDVRIYKGVAKYTSDFNPVISDVNSFYLDFSDNSSNAALGTDSSGSSNDWTVNNISTDLGSPVSVANATGALPIYNTTDTYGFTKGTGTRTDSNSASIVLALPMDGANNGTTFTDESATIKGSGSAKTATVNGNSKTSTAVSKYYGSSGAFDGTGDFLTFASSTDFSFGTGDFCIESWVYLNALPSTNGYPGANWVVGWGPSSSNPGFDFAIGSTNLILAITDFSSPNLSIAHGMSVNRWHHVAATRSGNTLRLFVDGSQIGSTTTTATASTNPNGIAVSAAEPSGSTGGNLNGYIQDLRIYKGAAKYTADFDPPKTADATVAAGNDSLVDSPTNGTQTDTGAGGEVVGNYATLNPLSITYGSGTLANGNLELTPAGSDWTNVNSTFAITSEKVYFEATGTDTPSGSRSDSGRGAWIGLRRIKSQSNWAQNGTDAYSLILNDMGYLRNGGSASDAIGAKISSGDVVGFAYDGTNGTYEIFFNGVSKSSGSVSTTSYSAGDEMYVATAAYPDGGGFVYGNFALNFGQRAFAYTAPSGFKALCTANLPDPTIADGSTAMDVALYTGNGSTQTISGLDFSPDFVWLKSRNNNYDHELYDVVRGATKRLYSNATDTEATFTNGLTSFDSSGFSVGSRTNVNGSGSSMVAWSWDGGTSTVSNTDGSITSNVRANASAGFSIVSYTGNGTTSATIGHGLNAAPEFVIVKRRDNANVWVIAHTSIGTNNLQFDTSAAYSPSTASGGGGINLGNSTTISTVEGTSSSVNSNALNGTYIAYCFTPVNQYSSFGSYTGNGSASGDGPFVFCNFRPRWILTKRTDSTNNWTIIDASRNSYNVSNSALFPNLPAQESTNAEYAFDILSNGFKVRGTPGDSVNVSGGTYIYAAFAEHPFALNGGLAR